MNATGPILEICCFTPDSVEKAAKSGAHRIELCSSKQEGGITPSTGTLMEALKIPGIEIYAMIRPRGGDFLYSEKEFQAMLFDIEIAAQLGAKGIVVGCLNKDGSINKKQCVEIKKYAKPLDITFHRAFDMCADPFKALDELAECGISRVLTSGTKNTALEGISIIEKLHRYSEGNITIMAGSGVNDKNIEHFWNIGIREFHSSAGISRPSEMTHRNNSIAMNKENPTKEFELCDVDEKMIARMRDKLESLSK